MDLPHLEFSTCGHDYNDIEVREFDVYAAAESQRKIRNSFPIEESKVESETVNTVEIVQLIESPREESKVISEPVGITAETVASEQQLPIADTDFHPPSSSKMPTKSTGMKSARIYKSSSSRLQTQASQHRQRLKASEIAKMSGNAKKFVLKTTVPKSPNLRINMRLKLGGKSSKPNMTAEDREMKQVEELRLLEQRRIRRAKLQFERSKVSSASQQPSQRIARSTKPLTIPSTPVSNLNKRMGEKHCSITTVPSEEPKDAEINANNGPRGLTEQQPFHFATDSRPTLQAVTPATSPEKLAGEMLSKFHADPRSHDAPAGACMKPTVASSPRLRTRSRSVGRPMPKSREQQEQEEMDRLQSQSFRAKPVDRHIFESQGPIGVPHAAVRPCTEPKEFHLQIDKRSEARNHRAELQSSRSDSHESTEFKALPMPDFFAVSSSHSTATVEIKPLTIPLSPKLSGKSRASSAPACRQKPHHSQVEQAAARRQVVQTSAAHQQLKLTAPREFNFQTSARGRQYQNNLESKIASLREQERNQREVHVKPPPHSTKHSSFVLMPSTKELTTVKEFDLASAYRHAAAQDNFQRNVEADQLAHKPAEFQARPLPKSTFEPTAERLLISSQQQQQHKRPTVVPVQVNFESDIRAQKRKEFNDQLAQKAQEQEALKEQQARSKLDKENQMVRELRCKSVAEGGTLFKATPVLTKDLYPTKQAVKPALTEPHSPCLLTKLRPRATHANQQSNDEHSLAVLQALETL